MHWSLPSNLQWSLTIYWDQSLNIAKGLEDCWYNLLSPEKLIMMFVMSECFFSPVLVAPIALCGDHWHQWENSGGAGAVGSYCDWSEWQQTHLPRRPLRRPRDGRVTHRYVPFTCLLACLYKCAQWSLMALGTVWVLLWLVGMHQRGCMTSLSRCRNQQVAAHSVMGVLENTWKPSFVSGMCLVLGTCTSGSAL